MSHNNMPHKSLVAWHTPITEHAVRNSDYYRCIQPVLEQEGSDLLKTYPRIANAMARVALNTTFRAANIMDYPVGILDERRELVATAYYAMSRPGDDLPRVREVLRYAHAENTGLQGYERTLSAYVGIGLHVPEEHQASGALWLPEQLEPQRGIIEARINANF